ncbi:hypothetical protein KJR58_24460 [Escherichia coli]|nr:hypothetical protein [Escherichia coli]
MNQSAELQYHHPHYTLALTGKVNPYSAGMGLMPGHVYRALYPVSYPNLTLPTISPC